MDYSFAIVCILSLVSSMFIVGSSKNYNVLSYGAVGNGNNDDTQAFIKAWTDTCKDSDRPIMLIPKGKTFLVHPVTFAGPCKSSQVNVQLSGNVIAPNDPNDWKGLDFGKWLTFQYVDGLTVSGDGLLDGRGKGWWDISCKYNPGKGCNKLAPSILRFENCNNVKTRRIRTVQSGGVHLVYFGCQGVEVTSVNIKAPDESPNTDGIRLSHSTSVSITDSIIGTGDDCIAMLDRSYNISITRVNCGPGHGISIGSLGGNGDEVDLENITISHINFYNTTNGARIKTWPAGKGQVRNVEFSNIKFKEVENPIIIDQHYGESKTSPPQKTKTGIQIIGVRYHELSGTSKTDMAMNFDCSENVPCKNISLKNIELRTASSVQSVSSNCNNAFGSAEGKVVPKPCLR